MLGYLRLGVGLETPLFPGVSGDSPGVRLETPTPDPSTSPGCGPGDPPVERQTCVKT